MSKKTSNKRKKIKRHNFYRPKEFLTPHGELSLRCFKKFINNFIDHYDWGNNKKHFCYINREYNQDDVKGLKGSFTYITEEGIEIHYKQGSKKGLNDSFTYLNKDGMKTRYNNYKLTEREVGIHLQSHDKRKFVFYVNSQFCHCPCICFDIDDLDITTAADIQKVVDFLLKLHPGSYFEKSTNGKGLHFYILLDFSDCKMDPAYFNDILYSYAYLLKLTINTMFKVNFDNVKSTYSNYSFSESHNCYLLEKCGTLCKLPKPLTYEDYKTLYSMPFTTLDNINSNAHLLCNYLECILDYVSSSSTAVYSFLSSNFDNIDFLIDWYNKRKDKGMIVYRNIAIHLKKLHSSTTPLLPTSTLTSVLVHKPSPEAKNKDEIIYSDEEFMEDSLRRELNFLLEHIREYYKIYNQTPSVEVCRIEYLLTTNYNKFGEKREKRFHDTYDYVIKTFDPAKMKKKRKTGIFVKNDYIEDIQKLYTTKESLKLLQQYINPKYKGRITYEDIAIAAGFYFVSLTRLLPQKTWASNQFTIAQNNMVDWFDELNRNIETARTCNKSKVKMLKDILIHIGWLECVDKSYFSGKRSRRYLMAEKFPRYGEFVLLVGPDNIAKCKNMLAEKCMQNKNAG